MLGKFLFLLIRTKWPVETWESILDFMFSLRRCPSLYKRSFLWKVQVEHVLAWNSRIFFIISMTVFFFPIWLTVYLVVKLHWLMQLEVSLCVNRGDFRSLVTSWTTFLLYFEKDIVNHGVFLECPTGRQLVLITLKLNPWLVTNTWSKLHSISLASLRFSPASFLLAGWTGRGNQRWFFTHVCSKQTYEI